MRKILAVSIGVVLVFSFVLGACKKKEQQPVPQAPQMMPGAQMPPGHAGPGGVQMTKTDLKVVVPEIVKGKWSGVKLVVEDKSSKKKQEFTVSLNGELKVPNSDLKISVGEFLPDFRMNADTITSASNELNNPAVRVKILEGDKEVFKGWLYSKFPTIHPFEHPKYSLTLKEAVKKG